VESPRREASSPRILPIGAEIPTTTLWHLWRAPPWPLADPCRTGHGIPLEFPANISLGVVGTRPPRVVWRSHPSSLSKRMREGRTLMMSKAMVGLAGSGACPQLANSDEWRPNAPQGLAKQRPMIQHAKALEGVTHSSEASGATPGGCARTHPPESNDATTPLNNSLKPLREWPQSRKGSGATVGYLN
jgi:hypothetical protein